MVISSSKEVITPDVMGDLAIENGYRGTATSLDGTSDGLFTYCANKWGLTIKTLTSSYEAHEYAGKGWFVVIACSSGLWTTGGHFILAVGADGDKIEIYDPYYYSGKYNTSSRKGAGAVVKGNSVWVQIDNFKAYSNAQRFYAFDLSKYVDTTPTTVYTGSTSTKTMYVNTSSKNLNVRSGAGTSYSIIGSLAKGTQVTVYETSNGWSRIGDGKWVSSEYLSSTKPSTSSSTSYSTTIGNTYRLKANTKFYSKGNLTGTQYDYLAQTEIKVISHYSTTVDYIEAVKTGRKAYCAISAFVTSSTSKSTVGTTKTFKNATTIYSKSDLTGVKYNYKANTTVTILSNISSTVDKIKVKATGRTGYVKTSVYK